MILLFLIVYVAIGAFIAGYFGDEDATAVITTLLWPIFLVGALIACILSLPYKLGQKIAELCERRKSNETN